MANWLRLRRQAHAPREQDGTETIYAAADGTLMHMDPEGSETEFGAGGDGGSQTVKCVDLGVVAAADVAGGATVLLYTPGADEIVVGVFGTDLVVTDGPGIAIGRALIQNGGNSRLELWPCLTLDNDTYHDSYGIAGVDPHNLPVTSEPLIAGGSLTVDAPPARTWEAETEFFHFDVVFANGTYWQTDDAGSSGSMEPDWEGNAGSSVSDGDLTWNDSSVTPPTEGSIHAYAYVVTPDTP